MKNFTLILAALLLLPAAAGAQALLDSPAPAPADLTEWNRVTSLDHGDAITVRVGHGLPLHCTFDGATKDRMSCELDSLLTGDHEYQFSRDAISTVRADQSKRNDWIIVGAFTAAGIVAGAIPNPQDTGTPRSVSVAITGAIGAAAGWFVSTIATPWIPGRLIYRNTPQHSASSTSTPSPVANPLRGQP